MFAGAALSVPVWVFWWGGGSFFFFSFSPPTVPFFIVSHSFVFSLRRQRSPWKSMPPPLPAFSLLPPLICPPFCSRISLEWCGFLRGKIAQRSGTLTHLPPVFLPFFPPFEILFLFFFFFFFSKVFVLFLFSLLPSFGGDCYQAARLPTHPQ